LIWRIKQPNIYRPVTGGMLCKTLTTVSRLMHGRSGKHVFRTKLAGLVFLLIFAVVLIG
jgi:hypothetical protein